MQDGPNLLPNRLAGRKHLLCWNWSSVAKRKRTLKRLIHETGISAISVKRVEAWSGYNSRYSYREICDTLLSAGVQLAGGWGYHYLGLPDREGDKVAEVWASDRPDYWIHNIEDPTTERLPDLPDRMISYLDRCRQHGPLAAEWFCSYAQPSYHEVLPYYQASVSGLRQMPMVYHTAMQLHAGKAVELCYDDYAKYGYGPDLIDPLGAAYGDAAYPIDGEGITSWATACINRGAESLGWWSLDTLIERPDLWAAIGAIEMPPWVPLPS